MAYKLLSVLGLVAISLGSPVQVTELNSGLVAGKIEGVSYGYPTQSVHVAPTAYKQLEYEQQFAPAAYDFNYAVHDEHTGDIKSQKEVRSGDSVQGRYELIDSDGFRRIVEYTADGQNGFNAVVHREPVDFKIPQPIAQDPKLVYSAPIAKEIHAQAQPIAKNFVYAAPQYSSPAPIRQYYGSPAYAAAAHSQSAHSSQANAGSVYSSPVHAAAIANHDESSPAPRIQIISAPVLKSQVYAFPAHSQNAYSALSAHSSQTAPNFNSVASVGPAYNVQTYSVPAFRPQSAHNQGYYATPVYNTAQPVARIVYSAPTAAIYSGRLVASNNYYNQGTPNSRAQAEYASLRFAQAQDGDQRATHATVAPDTTSESDLSQNNSNDALNSANGQSKVSYSTGSDTSYDAYRVSTTPSYKQ